jgi:predicted PurR-regulated permease PerM
VISILATLGNSTDLSLVFGVLLVNVIVQLIDNNVLVPKIVGNQVRINALASIVGVIVGGSIAGLPGMFLSIPLIAILKVVFDHVNVLKPWAHLIGNSMSDIH